MNIPFVDLKRQYKVIADEVNENVRSVMESGSFVFGCPGG